MLWGSIKSKTENDPLQLSTKEQGIANKNAAKRIRKFFDKQTNESFKVKIIVCMIVANVSMGDEIYIGTKRFP